VSHTHVLHSIHADRGRAAVIVAALWATAFLLSVFGAPDVAAWIAHDPWLSAQPAVVGMARGLLRIAEVTGIRKVHDAADRLAEGASLKMVWLREPANDLDIDLSNIEAQLEAAPVDEPRVVNVEAPRQLADAVKVHRVLLIGESSMQLDLGIQLEKQLRANYQGLTVRRFGKISTSLVRPDYFDWPAKLAELLAEFHPDLVIGNFGGNDAQPISDNKGNILRFKSDAWNEDFGARVTAVVDQVEKAGASLVLIGMPIMREPHFSSSIMHVNSIVQKRLEERGETFISTWDLAADAHGEYRTSITVDGVTGLMRWPDGMHYSPIGATYVTRLVLDRMERHVTFMPLDRQMAMVARSNSRLPYVTYVPQSAARGEVRVPVLVMLHGGPLEAWPEHAHRSLKELAEQHQVILVVPAGDLAEAQLVDDVLPEVEHRFASSGVRGIIGNGAGAGPALTLALEKPAVFTSASSMSGTPPRAQALMQEHPDRAKTLLVSESGDNDWPAWLLELPKHIAFHAKSLTHAPLELR